MSVSYSLQAATATDWSILRVLALWKGSLWKLVWKEMLIWLLLLLSINCLYYFGICGTEFEKWYRTALDVMDKMNIDGTMMFLLTYLTFNSLTRWSDTYKLLAWPENVALTFLQHFNEKAISGNEAKNLKNTMVRYLTAFYILIFRDVSTEVRQWFPTLQHLVDSKIITADELKLLQSSRLSETSCHYWVPIDWIALILKKRYQPKYIIDKQGRRVRNPKPSIMTDVGFTEFMTELNTTRSKIGDILSYDWVPIPLALIQTITVFVYSTLLFSLFKMQKKFLVVSENKHQLLTEIFVQSISTIPFTILYISFLRISQVVINPFGQDDDDFETPYLIQRHFNVLKEVLCMDFKGPTQVASMETENGEGAMLGHTVASALLNKKSEMRSQQNN